jgi:hypothetical protein
MYLVTTKLIRWCKHGLWKVRTPYHDVTVPYSAARTVPENVCTWLKHGHVGQPKTKDHASTKQQAAARDPWGGHPASRLPPAHPRKGRERRDGPILGRRDRTTATPPRIIMCSSPRPDVSFVHPPRMGPWLKKTSQTVALYSVRKS